MKNLETFSLQRYVDALSSRQPVPGGGSAAALVGALGAGLIVMAAEYSLRKGKSRSVEKRIRDILKEALRLRRRLMKLVDLDARAYMNFVKTRKAALKKRQAAQKKARDIPLETCCLCYEAIALTPDLIKLGNTNLISDVEVAVEFLWAAYNAAMINVRVNT